MIWNLKYIQKFRKSFDELVNPASTVTNTWPTEAKLYGQEELQVNLGPKKHGQVVCPMSQSCSGTQWKTKT